MARKTFRSDDVNFLLMPEDVEAGITTVGEWLDAKHMSRAVMKHLFQDKLVLLNGKKTNPKAAVTLSDELRLQLPKEKIDYEPIEVALTILYEDDDLLILDKPVGITVNSKGQTSLANGVAKYFKENGIKRKVRFLNRLDRDTSGCIIVAKSALAQSFYQKQIEDQRFEKWYTTTVQGVLQGVNIVELPMGRSEDGIHYEVREDGKMTRTAYNALGIYREDGVELKLVNNEDLAQLSPEEQAQLVTKVDVRLYTGKTHQIRVAMAHLGHPLVGDALYGCERPGRTYQLRAKRVVFTSLRTGQMVTVEAD
ncbi:RluA family pseudouridine synthase [Veillonella criceti]|uniref:RNA pseudouridylate synthase n=1 Tax=Veillonella criceti TaxID=103891 RepID=A0A380NL49_9FIRM|nr:RluA family pseudouridine synthase [Veillonella criceti]SUP43776.1 Ribosomal large subunit pseudouridine synthase D [Veillonella criceti]